MIGGIGGATTPLTAQCMSTAHFFTTGYQLGVLVPPGINPNSLRRSKAMCRVFNLRSGRHVHDFMVENWNNGKNTFEVLTKTKLTHILNFRYFRMLR